MVHAVSGGVPRVINLLCDRSLMLSAQLRVNAVTPAVVEEAAEKLSLTVPPDPLAERRATLRRWGIAAAAMLLTAAVVIWLAPLDRLVDTTPPARPDAPALRTAAPLPPVEPPAP
jgi:general secretion pathway protein A